MIARLSLALVLSVLAGVVLAGLALPLVGGAGLVAKTGADDFLALPSTVARNPLAQASTVLDRDGHVLARLFTENRVTVTLAQIPLAAQQAQLAIEDNRFYEHNGIDVKGTLRALARNSSSGSVQQGGSTLTQQYVKNLLIEDARSDPAAQKAAAQRSIKRKLQEARYALELEKSIGKAKILEGYFNIAYYGNGVYGIGTAAGHYFGVPVTQLTLPQAALLAGMVQNPRGFDPTAHPRAAVTRRNLVLDRMAELGKITPAVRDRARAAPLRLRVRTVASGCEAPGVTAPFFCDYVRRYLEDGPVGAVLGATRQERQQRLLSGGLTIRTTLDPGVQRAAQRAVDDKVPATDPSQLFAVSDVVEPGTGAVRAMAVDRPYGTGKGQTKVNFAIGGSAGFQGGSTFKAFVLARALQMGIDPHLTLNSPASYCAKAFTFVIDAKGTCPGNAGDSEAGTFDMVKATWESVNTYFIQLEERTGLITPPGLAEALGVRLVNGTFDGTSLSRVNPSFVLGAVEVSPLAMAGAYATFAARGLYCPPTPVVSITDSRGRSLDLSSPPCTQALEKDVADTVTGILRGVIDGPVANRTGATASIGRPAAGKTGTTDKSLAAWFVGYTPQLATAVWVGKANPTPLLDVVVNGSRYTQVYGGTIPAAIWRSTMQGALEGVAVEPFPTSQLFSTVGIRPSASPVPGTPVPDVSGQPVTVAADYLRSKGFAVTVGPVVNAGPVPAGSVARTVPAAGASVPVGSTVTLVPSNGLAPLPSPPATPVATPTAGPPPAPGPTKGSKPGPSKRP